LAVVYRLGVGGWPFVYVIGVQRHVVAAAEEEREKSVVKPAIAVVIVIVNSVGVRCGEVWVVKSEAGDILRTQGPVR
jgi:hypothetical protein